MLGSDEVKMSSLSDRTSDCRRRLGFAPGSVQTISPQSAESFVIVKNLL